MELFCYLITHSCLKPTDEDLKRLNECHSYIKELLYRNEEYVWLEQLMSDMKKIIKVDQINSRKSLTLKQICRFKLRNFIRNQQHVLPGQELRAGSDWKTSGRFSVGILLPLPSISDVFQQDPVPFSHLSCRILRDPVVEIFDLGLYKLKTN